MDHFYCSLFPLYSACQDGSNDGIHVNHRYRWISKTISGHKKRRFRDVEYAPPQKNEKRDHECRTVPKQDYFFDWRVAQFSRSKNGTGGDGRAIFTNSIFAPRKFSHSSLKKKTLSE